MGHTVTSQRIMIDVVLMELRKFSGVLRKDERMILEHLLTQPLKHVGATSYASSIDIWALLLLSILIEQEKRLAALEVKDDRLAR